MKILYHHRIASRDGQATHMEEMIHAMKGLGHEVLVVGPRVHERDAGSGGSAGWVGVLKRYLPGFVYELAEVGYSLVAYRRLAAAIRAFEPDVVYERYSLYMLAGVAATRRFKVPMLLEVNAPYAVARRIYGNLRLGWLADACERWVWRGASIVLPVTEVMADIIARGGVPRDRIRVIPNAIDPADYASVPATEEAKRHLGLDGAVVIGFTGFVREWDRLERVLKWLAEYRGTKQVRFVIVGDGPVRGELEALARDLGVADRLLFTGVVPREEVPRLAACFDVALQTALVPYASPLCLFEYLALGKAIVAPDQPNHHEVLRIDRDALFYLPDDDHDLERCLTQLVDDDALRARLSANAAQVVAERGFTWQANARRVVEAAAGAARP